MTAMMSFHAEKCCHWVSEHEAYAYQLFLSIFVIFST